MLSVYQHWDPLKVCAVGRSYPPEFYSFIENSKVRSVMERIAIETEEDYQKLIKLLESFNVTIVRNDISDNFEDHIWMGTYSPPPMTPRDHTIMIGDTFFCPGEKFGNFWINLNPLDNPDLPDFDKELSILQDIKSTKKQRELAISSIRARLYKYPKHIQRDFINQIKCFMRSINHDPLTTFPNNKNFDTFKSIKDYIKSSGNKIVTDLYVSGSSTTRVGKDLYYGTSMKGEDLGLLRKHILNVHEHLSSNYRTHVVDTRTHTDAYFAPVKPGLIVSLNSSPTFEKSFPGWEVVYLPDQSWAKVKPFLDLKVKNGGKWWVPGEELNDDFTDFVESWLRDWVLYVEETVFDVNMLVIDENNVVCNNYNEKVFDAFERHGITPHVINFRHRYFWDGGLHCITSDLHREGTMQDYFPS